MTDDEKKRLIDMINMFGLDSRADNTIPQQDRNQLLFEAESKSFANTKTYNNNYYYYTFNDSNFYIKNDENDLPQQRFSPDGQPEDRLEEMTKKPKKLFIASSGKGLKYATALQFLLMNHLRSLGLDIDCVLWNDSDVSENGVSIFANLERFANELYAGGEQNRMGYAVCLLTPDDTATINGEMYSVARDNVLFEYGLFFGKLGRERTFLLVPPENPGKGVPQFRVLSDLEGIQSIFYDNYKEGATITQAQEILRSAAQTIYENILKVEGE